MIWEDTTSKKEAIYVLGWEIHSLYKGIWSSLLYTYRLLQPSQVLVLYLVNMAQLVRWMAVWVTLRESSGSRSQLSQISQLFDLCHAVSARAVVHSISVFQRTKISCKYIVMSCFICRSTGPSSCGVISPTWPTTPPLSWPARNTWPVSPTSSHELATGNVLPLC